ncbi:MAG TPA: peroxiredoxin [Devosia sp.]|nr:peroxiredoxin [Devosia sp.]
MGMLEVGRAAPDFSLIDDRGGRFALAGMRGRPVVLAFYCEDDSGGCVLENQEFSALAPEFERAGATLVAISPQDVESHRKFSAKYGFAQPLLADPDLEAIKAYGLWAQKKLWGHEFMGVLRVTYLIGADGRIAGVFKASRIKGHAQKVLDAVRKLAVPAR